MSRASAVALAAALAAAGCGKSSTPAVTGQLRQPSSVAVFAGITIANPPSQATEALPYVAIANTDRNDLTILDGRDDSVLKAPVQLRPLAIPVERPALLAAASLGDVDAAGNRLPDLLIVVSAGDSRLQLIRSWATDNAVATAPIDAVAPTVELPGDVVDVVALPSPAGTARLAVAITGRRLAIVSYQRAADGQAVRPVPQTPNGPAFVVQPLAFEPASLATVPGDRNHVYAASREPVGPGPVFGVAELDVSAPAGPWSARALGARAATRLVAAAALHAEIAADTTSSDTTAFDGQPPVTRIYAVLDERSCGHDRAIDCGVVALDPSLDTATRGHSIPDDWAGSRAGERWMPYRAPLQFTQAALAIAVAQPPVAPPSGDPADQVYAGEFMRLVAGANRPFATTAVAAVAAADAQLHFIDLGRFQEASIIAVPPSAAPGVTVPGTDNRLWFFDDQIPPQPLPATKDAGNGAIHVTPGWTPTESWIVQYQGPLPGLTERRADAGSCASPPGCPGIATDPAKTYWIALQFGGPAPIGAGRPVTQVARIFHPALGVHAQDANGNGGDIVVIRAASVGGSCVGKVPPETLPGNEATAAKEFEVEIAQLFEPDVARPGGFVTIKRRTPLAGEAPPTGKPDDRWPLWDACFDALTQKIDAAPGLLVPNMIASIRAQALVLSGTALGYAGRPPFASDVVVGPQDSRETQALKRSYTLQYRALDPGSGAIGPDEDALAAACPLVDWDGTLPPPTCGGGACDRAVCEQAVLARKFRRVTHVTEDCGTDTTSAFVVACQANRDALGLTFPVANGPVLQFRVDRETIKGTNQFRDRNLVLSFSTASGIANVSVAAGSVTLPTGLITFDRSVWAPQCSGCAAGSYRFLAAYPAGLVVDASPVESPVSTTTVR